MDRWIDGYHALYTARTLHTVSRCWVRYPYLSVYIYIYLSIYLYLYLYLTRMMAAASMVICIAVGRLLSVESNHKAIAGGTGIGLRPRRRKAKPRPSGCALSIPC